MKHLSNIALGAFALSAFAVTPDAQAQSFLRGLAGKAKDKMEQKVDNKVDDAIDNALGNVFGRKKNDNSANSSNDEFIIQPENVSVEPWRSGEYFSLERANSTDETDDEGYYVKRIKKSNLNFKNQKDMLAALPAIPTTRQILSADAATIDKLIHFNLAFQDYQARVEQATIDASMKEYQAAVTSGASLGVPSRPTTTPMPATNALAQKMVEALMNSGIDMENADEEQVMKVAAGVMSKEYGIPEQEMVKMIKMSQTNPDAATAYMKKNYPAAAKKLQPVEEESKKAQEMLKVSPEMEEARKLFDEMLQTQNDEAYKAALGKMFALESELTTFANQLLAQWEKSPECAKIFAMEEDLNKRVNEYFRANNMGYNDRYPEFWRTDHQEQNAIINKYNEKMVEQWRAKLQECIDYFMPFAKRNADFAERVEALKKKAKAADADYLRMQNLLSSFSGGAFNMIYILPAYGMDSPRINNVSEDIDSLPM
ncbi:MAG: hypothetical protein MJZ15_05145 [Bacteroidales bacterium]|nr:hypothetical protein [Bacteroidales bacterium]